MKRKITVLLVMLFAVVFTTQAQQGQGRRTPEERAKMMAQRLTDSLQLTADQSKGVEAAFLQSTQAQMKLREGLPQGTQPEKADMDKITNTRDEQLKKVLTEAQFKRFKNEIEAAMMRRPTRPAGN